MRVRDTLEEMGIPYEIEEVDPRDRSKVVELTGQPRVPVIVDVAAGGKVISDSERIVEYLRENYGGAASGKDARRE